MVKYPVLLSYCPAKYSFTLPNDVVDEGLDRCVFRHEGGLVKLLPPASPVATVPMITMVKVIRCKGGDQ